MVTDVSERHHEKGLGASHLPIHATGWVFAALLLLAVCLWSGLALGRLIVPETELLVDAHAIKDGSVRISLPYNNGTVLPLRALNTQTFSGRLPETVHAGAELSLGFGADRASIEWARLDGVSLSAERIISTRRDTTDLFDYTVLRLPTPVQSRLPVSLGISAALFGLLICATAWASNGPERWRTLLGKFTYSEDVFAHLKPRDALATVLVFAGLSLVVVGPDAWSTYASMRLAARGIDVYQFQVALKPLTHFEFAPWPYNPPMTLFWSNVVYLWDYVVGSAPLLWGYPYWHILGLKAVNLALLALTVLTLLSYVIRHGMLSNGVRWVYYLTLFNPISFYVALVFVQFDTLPLYLITLGVVLLDDVRRNGLLATFVLTLGLTMKLQTMVLFPVIAVLIAMRLLIVPQVRWRQRIEMSAAVLLTFALVWAVMFQLHHHPGTAFFDLLSHFQQKDRVWFTAIPYAPGLMLHVAPFGTLLFFVLYVVCLHGRVTAHQLIVSTFLMFGALMFVFSAGIISTPSSFLHSLGAFFVLFVLVKDRLSQLALAGGSTLALTQVMLTDVGDISRILGWQRGVFSAKLAVMTQQDKAHYVSVLFTASVAGLVAFALLFLIAAILVLSANRSFDRLWLNRAVQH